MLQDGTLNGGQTKHAHLTYSGTRRWIQPLCFMSALFSCTGLNGDMHTDNLFCSI